MKIVFMISLIYAVAAWRPGGSRYKATALHQYTLDDALGQAQRLQPLSENDLTEDLETATKHAEKGTFESTFFALAENKAFINDYFQKKPYFCSSSLPNIAGAFTMDDVKEAVESDFLEAGRGTFDDATGGWKMAQVSVPRGKSFEDAKLQFTDVEQAMQQKSGTVVFNSAGGFIPKVAMINLEFLNAWELPCNVNMYLTAAGQSTSAPPHTDKQDVFVLQTQGAKRWRVFSPPPTAVRSRADPFARGKGVDKLDPEELAEPLLDVVVRPGNVLYVPAGYPHTTDTVNTGDHGSHEATSSVHLTLGLDSHIWSLNYASLRHNTLRRLGRPDKLTPQRMTKLPDELYWQLQGILPVGRFAVSAMLPARGSRTAMREHQAEHMAHRLVELMRMVEPERFAGQSNDAMIADLEVMDSIMYHIRHHETITDTFGRMYADVGMKMTPVTNDLSFFRSRPYLEEIETHMQHLEAWRMNGRRHVLSTAGEEGNPKKSRKGKSTAGATSATTKSKRGFGA